MGCAVGVRISTVCRWHQQERGQSEARQRRSGPHQRLLLPRVPPIALRLVGNLGGDRGDALNVVRVALDEELEVFCAGREVGRHECGDAINAESEGAHGPAIWNAESSE